MVCDFIDFFLLLFSNFQYWIKHMFSVCCAFCTDCTLWWCLLHDVHQRTIILVLWCFFLFPFFCVCLLSNGISWQWVSFNFLGVDFSNFHTRHLSCLIVPLNHHLWITIMTEWEMSRHARIHNRNSEVFIGFRLYFLNFV